MNMIIFVPCLTYKPMLTWTFNIIFVFMHYTFLPMPAAAMVFHGNFQGIGEIKRK